MNYIQWGNEYLKEAQKIRKHIDSIRENWSSKSQDEKLSVNRRTNILYEMYLECKHTGEKLLKRGEVYENQNTQL